MKKLILSSIIAGISTVSFAQNAPQNPVQNPNTTVASTAQVDPLASANKLFEEKKYAEAFKEYQRLSKSGNAQATYNMGVLYEQGLGVSKSDKKAVENYSKSASQGFAIANFALAKAYLTGGLSLKKDEAKGRNYLTLASNAGYPVAQLGLAQLLLKDGKADSTKTAVALLESLSAKKVLLASHTLALINLNKEQYDKADTQKGIKLLEQNAAAGYAPSIMILGEMNHKGIVLKKNLQNAESYYKVLSDNKVPNADKVLKEIRDEMAKAKK